MNRGKWYDLCGTYRFHMVNYGKDVRQIIEDIKGPDGKFHTEVLVEPGSEAEQEAIRLGGKPLN